MSPVYAGRYHAQSSYFRYFFNDRLEAAVADLDFSCRTILDIGAGTGALYNYLENNAADFQYFACDISPDMLAKSNIPASSQFIGKAHEIDFPIAKFDLVFMLGVTSYMPVSEVIHTMEFISERLSPNGKAILSFTHRFSLDFQVRRLLLTAKFIWRNRAPNKFGGYKPFSITGFCKNEVHKFAKGQFRIARIEWQNQTLSPFNHLLPKPSVFIARLLKRVIPTSILPFFSADFLVFFEQVKQ